jgi:PAS domain S-box-containing protein
LADAAALGLPVLAGVVAGAQEGVTIVDAERRFVYANPAACEVLGLPLDQLRGRDYLDCLPARDRAYAAGRFSERRGGSLHRSSEPFTRTAAGPDGTEREIVFTTFPIDVDGSEHFVTIFRDLTASRSAGRAGVALAQVTAQLVGTTTTDEILAGIARHAVEGTRALACGINAVGDDHKLVRGGYGPWGLDYGEGTSSRRVALADTLADFTGEEVIAAATGASITIGAAPGKPVVLPDARSVWEASPVMKAFAATLKGVDWQGGVYVPLSWEDRVFGMLGVSLPSGLAGPSEVEVAFYTALADQAAVALTNARLAAEAREAAAVMERARLARELHDSVSQALFSMTMHTRSAQLSMARDGVDESGPLGRSIAQLAELTQGALAEMRALIFEMRPGALVEEGLVAALTKQADALRAREQVSVTVEGPERRLELSPEEEEHLYRIASEALHNVVKHAHADYATVNVTVQGGVVGVAVSDNGSGFDPTVGHPGHLGLSTMAERAAAIGAHLTVTSAPGTGTTVSVSLPRGRRHGGNRAADDSSG